MEPIDDQSGAIPENSDVPQPPRRRRRRHRHSHHRRFDLWRSKHVKRHHGKQHPRLMRTLYFILACLLAATAVILMVHDTNLRRPATDESVGDPPTMYLFFAMLSALLAAYSMVQAILLQKRIGGSSREGD